MLAPQARGEGMRAFRPKLEPVTGKPAAQRVEGDLPEIRSPHQLTGGELRQGMSCLELWSVEKLMGGAGRGSARAWPRIALRSGGAVRRASFRVSGRPL